MCERDDLCWTWVDGAGVPFWTIDNGHTSPQASVQSATAQSAALGAEELTIDSDEERTEDDESEED
jgi:hypothetical protein